MKVPAIPDMIPPCGWAWTGVEWTWGAGCLGGAWAVVVFLLGDEVLLLPPKDDPPIKL